MKKIALLTAVTTALVTPACTPEEVAMFSTLAPPQQSGVLIGLQRHTSCHDAIDRLWPASSRAWAHRIVNRESHGIATAQNRRSSAAGCWQLLSMHAWRFKATGSSWAQRYEAVANTLAALHLYRAAGASPWS
jgi:hypothetical protein